ncbi:MAG: response regulator [Rhodocyclaceae bacterium]|nr:response regulator [Rhodocyclaceae bacterium]
MKELLIADKADVLVVDDQVENLELLINLLSPHYNVHPFTDGHALLRYVAAGRPNDLVLLDVVMPDLDGHQLCRQLTLLPEMQDVPIVFLTGLDSLEDEAQGLAMGAVDYITKPFSPPIVLARVANHVTLGRAIRLIVNQNDLLDQRVAERTAQLAQRNMALQAALKQVAQTRDVTIMAFSSLAETRDNETGRHLRRTQNYIRELALALRLNAEYEAALSDETIELIYKSAPLHDIGKVAIPDHILLKNGRLEPEEFAIMKTHAEHGRRAIAMAEANLEESDSFLQLAREIAYGHHEKWDGSGYPNGISGVAIPLAARMMAVADVYDALISRRVYKSAMSHQVAVGIITEGRGSHFDPAIVDAFLTVHQRFLEISEAHRDAESSE